MVESRDRLMHQTNKLRRGDDMKREIKFRIWDKEKGKMLNKYDVGFITLSYLDVYGSDEFYEFMQYAGLKDENGVEIYEGDIVRVEHTNYYETEIEPEYKPWIGKVIFKESGYYIQTGCDYHPSLSNIRIVSINVLGNVFENPELLEGEK